MFTLSHDYYAILGVAKNATTREIKAQYKKLMREHHPDQFSGLRKKYEAAGDTDLLKVLDEKIARAGEFCKLLNEAFEVLSDPAKRKQYDEQVYETKVEVPEIVVSPKTISFGTLTEGQKKSKVFTIENKGGPASSVDISWEGKPDWGDLVIDPNPDTTFPIKVTIIADTTGIPSGTKEEKILVTVDGQTQMVEVLVVVRAAAIPQPSSATSLPTGIVPSPWLKKTAFWRYLPLWVLGVLATVFTTTIVCGLAIQSSNQKAKEANQEQQAQLQAELETKKAEEEARAEATATAKHEAEEARRLISVEDVQLLTSGEVLPYACGSFGGDCSEVDVIRFTLVNGWVQPVVVWGSHLQCFDDDEVSASKGYFPHAGRLGLTLDAGREERVWCFWQTDWGPDDPDYCDVHMVMRTPDDEARWTICPYSGEKSSVDWRWDQ